MTAVDKSSQLPLLIQRLWESQGNNGRARLGLCHYQGYKQVDPEDQTAVNGEAALSNKVKYECSAQNHSTCKSVKVNPYLDH